ncbi:MULTISPECIES: cupin domain-containing protein [Haloferax]|uniref:Cupin domain-containing protein n=2 Tax=Haloferax TaxID=2251 RepID=A0A6G1Z2G2_9EURY|nr:MULTISPECIES: cupin domain-containing protein [Haloferax]KAB1187935.1 cupin domain-containing protein [Haloferax sp. CBA1149]MRW80601.1 cupin domain-containing protein [Haloferax marinisediminis]
MDRISIDDVEPTEAVDDVYLAVLAGGDKMNVQHFRIEPGASVPVHNHPHEQVGYIVSGELTFVVGDDGEEIVVGPGDSYSLAGDELHGADNRGDEPVVGIDVFSPPRDSAPWMD